MDNKDTLEDFALLTINMMVEAIEEFCPPLATYAEAEMQVDHNVTLDECSGITDMTARTLAALASCMIGDDVHRDEVLYKFALDERMVKFIHSRMKTHEESTPLPSIDTEAICQEFIEWVKNGCP